MNYKVMKKELKKGYKDEFIDLLDTDEIKELYNYIDDAEYSDCIVNTIVDKHKKIILYYIKKFIINYL